MRPGNGASDGAQTRIGFAAPGEALVEHEHLMRFAVPLSEEFRASAEPASLGLRSRAVRVVGFPQELQRLGVKAAERLRLNSIGHGADEELAAPMARRITAPQSAPLLS